MNKTTLKKLSLLFAFLLAPALSAIEISDLDQAERTKLEAFENVLFTFESKEFKNAPWPVVKIFALIKTSPLTAVSIFGALDYQEKYVPNTKRSKPIKHITPTEVLTEYEISVPFPLPNAKHVHGSILKKLGSDSYELSWYRQSSNSTSEARGFARFTPYKNNTLMEYQTFIVPNSVFGPMVKKIMISDVDNAVLVIRKHIEKLHEKRDPLINKYTDFTLRSLQGIPVYEEIIKQNK